MTPNSAGPAQALLLLVLTSCTADNGRADTASARSDVRFEVPEPFSGSWYKGNTHTHTTASDGDTPPDEVARWYRDHRYAFLVLSDHNTFVDPESLANLTNSAFLLIPGQEVTSSFDGTPVHVNGLNLPGLVEARTSPTLVGTVQANVDAVREVEGVPHINHPNFRWAFGTTELRQVERYRLLEIHNGHPQVHNRGGGGTPGVEAVWDSLLTDGRRVYGIAVDDAHHFQGEFAPDRANPGRGWVSVNAPELEPGAIMEALENGRFYASGGVELSDIVVSNRRIEVHIATRDDFRYTTTFVGAGGRVLGRSVENPAVYELHDDVSYVRARVEDSMGYEAWTQPVFVLPDTMIP